MFFIFLCLESINIAGSCYLTGPVYFLGTGMNLQRWGGPCAPPFEK